MFNGLKGEALTRIGERNLRPGLLTHCSPDGRDCEGHDGTHAADDEGPEDGGLVAGGPLDVQGRVRPEGYGCHCEEDGKEREWARIQRVYAELPGVEAGGGGVRALWMPERGGCGSGGGRVMVVSNGRLEWAMIGGEDAITHQGTF